MSMPAMLLNSSPDMCGAPPVPLEANVSLPGLALPYAMSSFTLFTGSLGLTTSTSGTTCVRITGSKLFTVSYGSFLNITGLIAWLLATSASMWPSGAAVATACVPMVPVAPALLSITTGLPQSLRHLVAGEARDEVDGAARRRRAR